MNSPEKRLTEMFSLLISGMTSDPINLPTVFGVGPTSTLADAKMSLEAAKGRELADGEFEEAMSKTGVLSLRILLPSGEILEAPWLGDYFPSVRVKP